MSPTFVRPAARSDVNRGQFHGNVTRSVCRYYGATFDKSLANFSQSSIKPGVNSVLVCDGPWRFAEEFRPRWLERMHRPTTSDQRPKKRLTPWLIVRWSRRPCAG